MKIIMLHSCVTVWEEDTDQNDTLKDDARTTKTRTTITRFMEKREIVGSGSVSLVVFDFW
jgi:hypothetical protein